MKRFIRVHSNDMVATALDDVLVGDKVSIFNSENEFLYDMTAFENIPFGNKIALCDIAKDDKVVKYDAVIGKCVRSIKKGELVHVHNVITLRADIPSAIRNEIIRQMGIEVKEDR